MVLHPKGVFVFAPSVVDGGRVCQEIFDEANSESEAARGIKIVGTLASLRIQVDILSLLHPTY